VSVAAANVATRIRRMAELRGKKSTA